MDARSRLSTQQQGALGLDQATQQALVILGTEITSGAVTGFFVGYGLRKVVGLLFKVVAVIVALFTLGLMALVGLHVVKVDFQAFAALVDKLFLRLLDFVIYITPTLVHYFPISGSFGLGVALGAMKR